MYVDFYVFLSFRFRVKIMIRKKKKNTKILHITLPLESINSTKKIILTKVLKVKLVLNSFI